MSKPFKPLDFNYICKQLKTCSIIEVAKDINMSPQQLYTRLKLANINFKDYVCQHKRRNKILFNENFFEKINNEYNAYWLGFLYADGCVYHKDSYYELIIGLSIKDIHHLELFRKHINSTKKIYIQRNNVCSFRLQSDKLYNDLINLGCGPRKSLTLNFPTIEQVPFDLLRHFVRGFLDGDGCLYLAPKNRIVCCFNSTALFLDKLKINLNNILGLSNLLKISNSCAGNCYKLSYSNQLEVIKLLHWLYDDNNVCLQRKYNIAFPFIKE